MVRERAKERAAKNQNVKGLYQLVLPKLYKYILEQSIVKHEYNESE